MDKKKIVAIIIIILIVFAIVGYITVKNLNKPQNGIEVDQEINRGVSLDGKVLVTYFSHSGENYSVGNVEKGNTKMMAEYIIDYLNADTAYDYMSFKEWERNFLKERRLDLFTGGIGENCYVRAPLYVNIASNLHIGKKEI